MKEFRRPRLDIRKAYKKPIPKRKSRMSPRYCRIPLVFAAGAAHVHAIGTLDKANKVPKKKTNAMASMTPRI